MMSTPIFLRHSLSPLLTLVVLHCPQYYHNSFARHSSSPILYLQITSLLHSAVELIQLPTHGYVFLSSQYSHSCWYSCQCPKPIQYGRLKLHLLYKTLNLSTLNLSKAMFSYGDPMTTFYLDHVLNISQKYLNLSEAIHLFVKWE